MRPLRTSRIPHPGPLRGQTSPARARGRVASPAPVLPSATPSRARRPAPRNAAAPTAERPTSPVRERSSARNAHRVRGATHPERSDPSPQPSPARERERGVPPALTTEPQRTPDGGAPSSPVREWSNPRQRNGEGCDASGEVGSLIPTLSRPGEGARRATHTHHGTTMNFGPRCALLSRPGVVESATAER
ncbi:hypothetical protein F6X51_09310 [Methylobacterium planeticum]|uniref:Uncharacterized protein n=1 Tax=Methylobacterium planeticum TaxID=2615211 RepID=A0A6N6MU41_9HYPH|nr:hypothetical protein F6X51_09310 [Methylobacterium planeticum]